MAENPSTILVIDETIREGMQYRGLMYSLKERLKILSYQESLGVDVSQVGYPPAHVSECDIVSKLNAEAQTRDYNIRIAGLGRAILDDARLMVKLGLRDFHLHSGVNEEMLQHTSVKHILDSLAVTVGFIRKHVRDPSIKISLLDVGRTDEDVLQECASFLLNDLRVDILALPDTSGVMTPNVFCEKVQGITRLTHFGNTTVSVHCHNDMGMASANTLMGVVAGATGIEVSVLGIGERNGIGDIFTVGKCLKDLSFDLRLRTEKQDSFKQYYLYINSLCEKKLGTAVLDYDTPFFGKSMDVHVAGTHASYKYGTFPEEEFCLNVLCGRELVRKYLRAHAVDYREDRLREIVTEIKNESVVLGRALNEQEITKIANGLL